MYQPAIGHRVRVIRYRTDGRVHFDKTGTITDVFSTGYMWHDDEDGACSLAGGELVASLTDGWSQTIEQLPDSDEDVT